MIYPPIIVIAGPTAIGKSKLAVDLAKKFDGYIINADSRQVYKELSVGTARPSEDEIQNSGVTHYLFGHKTIHEEYSVFEYQKEVKEVLKKNKDKVAFLVGGTGLYIDSIVHNYRLKKNKNTGYELQKLTTKELQNIIGDKLSELNVSDRENPRRLTRFIQKDYQSFNKGKPLEHLYLVYYKDFDIIEENIKLRIEKMFTQGLEKENLELKKYNFLETIGYREFEQYFEKKITLQELKQQIYTNTRKYAKRQITWFKRNKTAVWVKNHEQAKKECKNFLANLS